MSFMRWSSLRLRAIGGACAIAALAVAVSAIASAATRAHVEKAAAAAVACSPGTAVTVSDGPVCGVTVNGINEWLGIPYAAPPVGALRWQPPLPPASWTNPLQATQFASECAHTSRRSRAGAAKTACT